MKRVVFVPARSGSKRLPGKNTKLLAGKPLVCHTLDVVRPFFDTVVLSSDSDEVLDLAIGRGAVAERRPAELATDTSKVIDTVAYHFQRMGGAFDQVWLCLPTCPLRNENDISAGFELLDQSVDGVVSVTDYEFPPALGLLVKGQLLVGRDEHHPLAAGNSRSQDQERVLRPNGAFYGMWRDSFLRNLNFFRGKIRPYFMPRARSVDIDTELDFQLAELILSRG